MDSEHDESKYFPFSYSSFEFLKQRLRTSNQTQKLENMNNVMAFLGMDDEKGRQVESSLHSKLPYYEKDDNQPSVVHEECYNLFL